MANIQSIVEKALEKAMNSKAVEDLVERVVKKELERYEREIEDQVARSTRDALKNVCPPSGLLGKLFGK